MSSHSNKSHPSSSTQSGRDSREVLGKGTFGVVVKATKEGKVIAEKIFHQEYQWVCEREARIVKEFQSDRHPNIIRMFGAEIDKRVIYFELMDCNLYELVKSKWTAEIGLGLYEPLYVYQMFRGLGYMGSLKPEVIHRDLKPENLLISHARGVLKIADFGSACHNIEGRQQFSYVCSRWYRAPEMIAGCKEYKLFSPCVDFWSAGSIMYEVITSHPLFPCKSDDPEDQLHMILQVLGSPREEEIAELDADSQLEYFDWTGYGDGKGFLRSLQGRPGRIDLAADLLSRVVRLAPSRRMKPYRSCAQKYFDVLRREGVILPNNRPLPNLFEFKDQEKKGMSQDVYNQLIPNWMANPSNSGVKSVPPLEKE